jgi:hypothetical protein
MPDLSQVRGRTVVRFQCGLLFLTLCLASERAKVTQNEPTNNSSAPSVITLDSLDGLYIQAVSEQGLDLAKVRADITTYKGRRALHLTNDDA